MTRTELWIWAGVSTAVAIAVATTAMAGGNWLLPLVPLGIGGAFWGLLCWFDRRDASAHGERDRHE